MEYDKIITNEGGAYDTRHGHFVAPYSGMYLLSFSVMNSNGDCVYLEMVKNGVRIAVVYAHSSNYNMGSQTILNHLDASDMVWVRHSRGDTTTPEIYGSATEPYNTFSGVLLYES